MTSDNRPPIAMYIPARIARVRVFRVLKEIFCMAVFSAAVIISGDDNTLIARIKRFFYVSRKDTTFYSSSEKKSYINQLPVNKFLVALFYNQKSISKVFEIEIKTIKKIYSRFCVFHWYLSCLF